MHPAQRLIGQARAALLALAFTLVATAPSAQPIAAKDAEPATRAANAALERTLPFGDRSDFDDARRGLVGTIPGGRIGTAEQPVWNMERYAFLDGPAPPTVNPSLWRQAQLNSTHGLFKVAERVYQVRGLDIANMTIVEADHGLIVTDALLSAEAAKAAIELYYAHRPRLPIVAVIYSHSHVDHYGGVRGLVGDDDVRQGKVRLIAPDGFLHEAVSENIIAGPAMGRRALYQFGPLLPVGERGQVDTGLGKNLSRGTVTLIAPNDIVKNAYETRTIDGVEIEFHLVPGSEAPAEMIMYYPQLRLLNMAEDATHTLHNLYTIRGAQVRDGRLWARYLNEAIERYGARTDALVAQHHWPTWGQDRIVDYLRKQRDLYEFIHDQSVRLLNKGYTPAEIAEQVKLPPSLAGDWAEREYYGTVSHNSKAVYQFYLGWYDANPAHLNPLPPVESAKKTIEYMGGADAVLARARADFRAGNYRWVASVLSDLVFADPGNRAARELAADALEQLGYQAESGPWRNAYLSGASELRNGVPRLPPARVTSDVLAELPIDTVFDLMAIRVDPAKAEGRTIVVNWTFTDSREMYVLTLDHSALTHTAGRLADRADAGVSLSRATFLAVLLRQKTIADAARDGEIKLDGDPRRLAELFAMLDDANPAFPIVEPK
jgi:alkyl sulfatase BDS1-like metallo-beta-lactamase superfamily hydrolase